MSRNPHVAAIPLDYMRPSPVRGQLEVYDPKGPEGWRYIQTTDTPGELKVLLPPGTAAMYEQLLKLEAYELTKKSSVAWERIMEIRHLKDRMIRKCQRLAKPPQGLKKVLRSDPFVFQTVIAPSDFRLKEMEKWFRDQQKRLPPYPRKPTASKNDVHQGPSTSHQRLPSYKAPLVLRSSTTTPPQTKGAPPPISGPTSHRSRVSRTERSLSLPVALTARASAPIPPILLSPLPLPILLLSQREEYGLESPPDSASEKPAPLLPEKLLADEPSDESTGVQSPEQGDQGEVLDKPLRRRRSCIKRSSMSDLVKTVSWADGQDLDKQLAHYVDAAKQAQASGTWGEVRSLYVDQIKGLENLHEQVKEGLDHLRLESDHLQRIDGTIRQQRESLEKTFKEFEDKYTLFQEKVQEALAEASDNLVRINTAVGLPPIDETNE